MTLPYFLVHRRIYPLLHLSLVLFMVHLLSPIRNYIIQTLLLMTYSSLYLSHYTIYLFLYLSIITPVILVELCILMDSLVTHLVLSILTLTHFIHYILNLVNFLILVIYYLSCNHSFLASSKSIQMHLLIYLIFFLEYFYLNLILQKIGRAHV